MFETIDKLMLAGLGALSMTRERAEKIFDEYVNRGKMEKGNRTGFVKELMASAERTRQNLEKLVAEQVDKSISKLNLTTHTDIQRLEEKIDKLLNRE